MKYITLPIIAVLIIGYFLGAYYGSYGKSLVSKVTG